MSVRGWAIAAAILLVTAAVAAGSIVWLRAAPPPPHPVEATIGTARLLYLQSFARQPAGRDGGRLDRLDLAVLYPGFEPAGAIVGLTPKTDVRARTDRTLFFTIAPAEDTLDPVERPIKLYARFLGEPLPERPDGLVERQFETGSPFETEDLVIAPPEGRAFYARCPRPGRKSDGLPSMCIHDFRLRGLDVQLRFSATLLPQWRELVDGARTFVEGLLR